MRLTDQRILVVGGTSGMGEAAVVAAVHAGGSVVLTGRSAERARAAAERLSERAGGRTGSVVGVAADVSSDSSFAALKASVGRVDHVFVAAGATRLASPLSPEPLEELMRACDDRVKGSMRVVRAFAPEMPLHGSFVFTGGLSTDRPVKGAFVSGLGTATAEQLARVLALELAPLRFNAVLPGWTDTPMWDQVLGENKESVFREVSAKWPIPRLVTADEVASAVVFLMSNRAITGEVLHVDGGQRLA